MGWAGIEERSESAPKNTHTATHRERERERERQRERETTSCLNIIPYFKWSHLFFSFAWGELAHSA